MWTCFREFSRYPHSLSLSEPNIRVRGPSIVSPDEGSSIVMEGEWAVLLSLDGMGMGDCRITCCIAGVCRFGLLPLRLQSGRTRRRLFELAVLPLTIIDELLPLGPVLFTTSSRGGLTSSITSRYRAVVLERIDKGGSVSGSFHAELRVRRR